jgi:hypothetical protein
VGEVIGLEGALENADGVVLRRDIAEGFWTAGLGEGGLVGGCGGQRKDATDYFSTHGTWRPESLRAVDGTAALSASA